LERNVATAVAALTEQPGSEFQVHGSADLIQTSIEPDLVDQSRLWFSPLVLGNGKRLFAAGAVPAALKLVDTKTSSTGVAIHTYERAGAIQYGSFEVDVQGKTEALWT